MMIEKTINLFYGEEFIRLLLIDLIESNLPEDLHYLYYILYPCFVTVFSANIVGMFSFSFTETTGMPLVLTLSAGVFFGVFITGLQRKGRFLLGGFLPPGTPLAIGKLLIAIEVISYTTRVASLALRLMANMISGHILLKILVGFV